MGLRQLAANDLAKIVEDDSTGPGYPIAVTNPAGLTVSMIGLSNDISQLIDPETGIAVSGRSVSVALVTSSLLTNGLGMPSGISSALIKPWIVSFDDINGATFTFKISAVDPDRSIGLTMCLLEFYQPASGVLP